MEIDLTFFNKVDKDFNEYEKDFLDISKTIKELLNIKETISFSVSIVDNKEIKRLNSKYRDRHQSTDVLSFAFEESLSDDEKDFYKKEVGFRELGDIFISQEKAVEQANQYQHSLRREICFLFNHGLLHLLGYDHKDEEKEKEMFKLQDKVLNLLGIERG